MKKEMSKKSFYSLVVFGIIFLLGVVVAIAPAVTKNPGHDISEIGVPAGCSDGSILKWIESSETWSCGADEVGDNLGNHLATLNLSMGSNRIINLGDPIENTDAATKSYIDSVVYLDGNYRYSANGIYRNGLVYCKEGISSFGVSNSFVCNSPYVSFLDSISGTIYNAPLTAGDGIDATCLALGAMGNLGFNSIAYAGTNCMTFGASGLENEWSLFSPCSSSVESVVCNFIP